MWPNHVVRKGDQSWSFWWKVELKLGLKCEKKIKFQMHEFEEKINVFA